MSNNGMDEFKQVFFAECAELLADMEARLLTLDAVEMDMEQINAIFRCAHSIKGGPARSAWRRCAISFISSRLCSMACVKAASPPPPP